jgi:DNA-binding CsgD family transcriptional regulator
MLELYKPSDLAAFRRRMVAAANRAFGGEMVCHNELHPASGRSLSILSRPVKGFDQLREAFFAHVQEHPSIQHHIRSDGGDTRAVKTSDFLTQRKWRSQGLYREFYRPLADIRYQLTIGQKIDGWLVFFAVSRSDRDFTEQERMLLTLLRPHFIQAYENARLYSALSRVGEATAPREASVEGPAALVCGCEGNILDCNEAAAQVLERWFDWSFEKHAPLPRPLRQWLGEHLNPNPDSSSMVVPPYRIANALGELEVRGAYDGVGRTCQFSFSERLAGNGAASLRSQFGLSLRQTEVLRWLVEGKTNAEIAAILRLGLPTIKTHVSAILDKLGVETRSAAVCRVLERERPAAPMAVNGLD